MRAVGLPRCAQLLLVVLSPHCAVPSGHVDGERRLLHVSHALGVVVPAPGRFPGLLGAIGSLWAARLGWQSEVLRPQLLMVA